MINKSSVGDLYIDMLKRELNETSGNVEQCADNFVDRITSREYHQDNFNLYAFWDTLGEAQSEIEIATGVNDSIRAALLRRCRRLHKDEKILKRELFYYMPTAAERQKQIETVERYHERGKQFSGEIIDVKKNTFSTAPCVSGISREKSASYTENNGFFGGNGTYRAGYSEYNSFLFLVVKLKGHPLVKINVRDAALKLNQRERITDVFAESLKGKLKGKKVKVEYDGCVSGVYKFRLVDTNVLKI